MSVKDKVKIRTRNALQVALGVPSVHCVQRCDEVCQKHRGTLCAIPNALGNPLRTGGGTICDEGTAPKLCLGTNLHQHVRNILKCGPVPADL